MLSLFPCFRKRESRDEEPAVMQYMERVPPFFEADEALRNVSLQCLAMSSAEKRHDARKNAKV